MGEVRESTERRLLAACSVAVLSMLAGCTCEGTAAIDLTPFRDAGGAMRAADAGAADWDGGPPSRDAGPAGDAGIDRCALRESREPVTMYLSADDSNSMASPVIARRMLRVGQLPPARVLRTYEFLNYYDVVYDAPANDHVAVVPELREAEDGSYVLQIGVQGAPAPEPARPRTITLVLDRSGSMNGAPIQRERDVVRAIARHLRPGDLVSAVMWNTERTVPLEGHAVTGPDDAAVLELASALDADGGTDLEAGLRFGYEIARRLYDPDRLNRVVLVSDGLANAGITDIELIDDASEDAEAEGIYLVGVGVGEGINDTLMDAVTDAGRGAYVYVDDAAEAERMFGARWNETMEVGLLDVRLELTLPWYMAITEFHGEEIAGVPARVRPQHLAPGDTMVFHLVLAPCEAGHVEAVDTLRARATYVRPSGRVSAEDGVETSFGALLAGEHPHLDRGDAIVEYAEGLALAYDNPFVARDRLRRALSLVDALDPGGADATLAEVRELADLALQLLTP